MQHPGLYRRAVALPLLGVPPSSGPRLAVPTSMHPPFKHGVEPFTRTLRLQSEASIDYPTMFLCRRRRLDNDKNNDKDNDKDKDKDKGKGKGKCDGKADGNEKGKDKGKDKGKGKGDGKADGKDEAARRAWQIARGPGSTKWADYLRSYGCGSDSE